MGCYGSSRKYTRWTYSQKSSVLNGRVLLDLHCLMSTVHPVSNLRISISLAASKRFLSISTFSARSPLFPIIGVFYLSKGKCNTSTFWKRRWKWCQNRQAHGLHWHSRLMRQNRESWVMKWITHLGVETERWKRKGRSPHHARTVHFVFILRQSPTTL